MSAKKIKFVSQYKEYSIRPEISSPAQSWEKSLKKSQKIWKNHFFKKIFFCQKNVIPLVFPIEEISLWPGLSSPPRFRIQGGSTSVTEKDGWTEILVSNIRYKQTKKHISR